jgi:hypothetical protein
MGSWEGERELNKQKYRRNTYTMELFEDYLMQMVGAMIERITLGRDHDQIKVCRRGIVVVIDAYDKGHDRDRKGGCKWRWP